MDNLDHARRQIKAYLLLAIGVTNLVVIAIIWALEQYASLTLVAVMGVSLIIGSLLALIASHLLAKFITQPLQAIWQVILHLSPSTQGVSPPTMDDIRVGRELVTSLSAQVYQLASVAAQTTAESQRQSSDLHHNFIAENLPLPLIVLDPAESVLFANEAAAQYVGIASKDMIGKNIYMVLDMSFPSEATFDTWLKSVKNQKATAMSQWERVRLNVGNDRPGRLFDLAAYYNQGNRDHTETMLVLFDHTKQYSQDDQAISFIALSVHELRTPLTLLRGYIEVFEEELTGKVDAELQNFILKMRAQSDQLMAYVNNILNVARVDDDQLELRLESADWRQVLKSTIQALSLQAKVRGISLHCRIQTDLPEVGIDRISIQEVINNLVDNAIKYSGTSKTINIETHLTKDGLVETTIQDFGLGISTSIMPNLFTKFYRDHRNRAQIGGTGLGLYLSKALVTAHGGNLWVRSQEGKGSTFGFTLLPYTQIAENVKQTGDQQVTRNAHGWIKNHSLYRR
jgi:two-component system sensor histidine kinase VicK